MAKKITIADLFPDGEGMMLVGEDAVDGSLRHISDVANGAACECICFGCGKRLIAKNGGDPSRVAHHFAHRAEDVVVDCVSAGETALHIRAKEIIAKHCRVTLPATSILGLDGKLVEVTPERSVELTDVKLEAVAGELIPDVTATMPDGRRIFIEIANTHFCPPEKIEKLDVMGVEVLEITVSAYRDAPLDELDDIILDIAPRKLILSREVKVMAAGIAAEQQRQEDRKRAKAQRLVAIYRDPLIRNHLKAQALAEGFVNLGLADFVDMHDNTPSAFIIYRRQWQAAILDRLLKANSELLKPMDFLDIFARGRWAKDDIAYIKSEHSKWIAANIAEDFKSPYEEVLAYLVLLRKLGAVYEVQGHQFAINHEFGLRVEAAIEKRTRPERRMKELKIAFRNIGALMLPEDGRLPNFALWLEGRTAAIGISVEELLAGDDGDFDELMDRLDAIEKMIMDMQAYKNLDEPEDMAGLPMSRLISRLRTARIEEERRVQAERAALRRRQEAEAAALQRQEVAGRVLRLTEAAIFIVPDVDAFLDTPLSDHNGKTPRQLASESYQGFSQVQAILSNIREAEQVAKAAESLKRDMIGKLWERVYSRIPRREIADLWSKQPWKELGGKTPLEYCKDEKTLARCFEVLEDFVASDRRRRR